MNCINPVSKDGPAGSRDAPSLVEIEITSEMIAAGARVLRGYTNYFEDEEHGAARIFLAMYQVHLAACQNERRRETGEVREGG
jgi:hypothetical protein